MRNKSIFLLPLVLLSLSFTLSAQWQEVGIANDTMLLAQFPDIAFHPVTDAPYVSFAQNLPPASLVGANLTMYDGNEWKYVGGQNFSPALALFPNLEFNPNTNEPYIAFTDDNQNGSATVMKHDGNSWVTVGSAGFSSDTLRGIHLAFHPTTFEPYVTFTSKGDGNKISVMKFDGNNWVYVGTQAFSSSDGGMSVLAFHPTTHVPYVVYFDNSIGVVAQMFDGSGWTNLAAFPNLSSAIFDAGFSPSGELHVLISDYLNGKKASVVKYSGSAWSYVGAEGFTTGAVPGGSVLQGEALAFTAAGTPYIALRDDVDNDDNTPDSLSVMTFNGSAWEKVGNALVAGTNFGFSIAISAGNEPHVVYADDVDNFMIHVKKYGASVVVTPPAQPDNLTVTATNKRPAFDKMQLTWTDNANNEDGFQIERSLDNSIWDIIDSLGVDAAAYLDSGLTPGTTYFYRVLAYNAAGASAYSNVDSSSTGTATAIQQPLKGDNILIYPNPASSRLLIKNVSPGEIKEITITDICGKQVKEFFAANDLDIRGISPGVYWLTISTAKNRMNKKLVIH